MTVKEIRKKARGLHVANYSRLNKAELIRAVQRTEGNQECFLQITDCRQDDCCWWGDCQSGTQPRQPT